MGRFFYLLASQTSFLPPATTDPIQFARRPERGNVENSGGEEQQLRSNVGDEEEDAIERKRSSVRVNAGGLRENEIGCRGRCVTRPSVSNYVIDIRQVVVG